MDKFFKDIMLDHGAIYTLWGSKPLTLIIIEHFTDEEIQKLYDSLTEEEKKECQIREEKRDIGENWKKWKQIHSKFPSKRYMLFESDWYPDPEATFVFFVDILKTMCVLQEHYEIFRKVVGFDFDPTEVVFEMQNKESLFWEKTRGNAFLWGILFGFGKENAYAFNAKHFQHGEKSKEFFVSLKGQSSDIFIPGPMKLTLNNFDLPWFISFHENDPVVKKYQKERRRIKKNYKGKDFLELTLQKLMQE